MKEVVNNNYLFNNYVGIYTVILLVILPIQTRLRRLLLSP